MTYLQNGFKKHPPLIPDNPDEKKRPHGLALPGPACPNLTQNTCDVEKTHLERKNKSFLTQCRIEKSNDMELNC